jgi:hypothetical protein
MNQPKDREERFAKLEQRVEALEQFAQDFEVTLQDDSSQTDRSQGPIYEQQRGMPLNASIKEKAQDMTQGKDPMDRSLRDLKIAELNACLEEELREMEKVVQNITKGKDAVNQPAHIEERFAKLEQRVEKLEHAFNRFIQNK